MTIFCHAFLLVMFLSCLIHQYQDLIRIFNQCFASTYNTRLVKGGDEPIYLPADDNHSNHRICFAHGFFSSALHECSHWLIAGEERRKQVDFGYWYLPDGRTEEQQKIFEQVEVKPQAMEWILSVAANHSFRISADNLTGPTPDTKAFRQSVYQQVLNYCSQGLPKRALILQKALSDFYGTACQIQPEQFDLASL